MSKFFYERSRAAILQLPRIVNSTPSPRMFAQASDRCPQWSDRYTRPLFSTFVHRDRGDGASAHRDIPGHGISISRDSIGHARRQHCDGLCPDVRGHRRANGYHDRHDAASSIRDALTGDGGFPGS